MFAVIREGEFVGTISPYQQTKSVAAFDLNFGLFPLDHKEFEKIVV